MRTSALVAALLALGLHSVPSASAQDAEGDDAAVDEDAAVQDADVEEADLEEADLEEDEAPEDEAGEVEVATPEEAARSEAGDMQDYAAQLRQRQDIAAVHRALGIATWGSMLVTVVLGAIQFHNLYGGFGGVEDTPCVQGDPVFGDGQCWGTPYPHLIAAGVTTALYAATFTLSFTMPDPDNISEGDSDFAQTLQVHKALRWVHLAGMIAQIGLGIVVANSSALGIDRANDYDAQLALAAVHQGIGWVTLGALTAAGAIMIF